MTYTTK